jgi:hypothetical protein
MEPMLIDYDLAKGIIDWGKRKEHLIWRLAFA